MKNNKFVIIFSFIILIFNNSFSISNGIKVVVGRDIITEQDVINRIHMIAFLSHVDTAQLLKDKKIMNDLVTTLIYEKLLAKQVKKNKILINENSIQESLGDFLKKSNINDQSFKMALKNGNLNLETLRGFIINDISLKELVGKKIYPKLRSSKYNKDIFVEKLYQKFQRNSGVYKIYQFSKEYDNSFVDLINKKTISDCSQIEQIAKELNLKKIFVSNFKVDELNQGMRSVILSKDTDRGIFAYKDESDMNIIGFCQIEKSKVNELDQKKLDLIYRDHLLSKAINDNYKALYDGNFILVKN